MSASVTSKKQCVKCDKGGGILTCDGCQQSFCGKHVNEHRQELALQLDNIMQEHDSLQHDLEQPSLEKNPLLLKINEWEKESIARVQAAAETARRDLQELLRQSKERISKMCLITRTELRSSREADDFSENDLTRWKEQLKELKIEVTSPSSAKLVGDKKSAIRVMKLTTNDPSSNQTANSQTAISQSAGADQPASKSNSATADTQERFLQTLGPFQIEDGSRLAKHVGSQGAFAHLRGRSLYYKDCHVIRFKIEHSVQPYHIFFGCMSSEGTLTDNAYRAPHAVGWFGYNQVHEHGRCSTNCQKHGYNSGMMENNDELHLILDCDKEEIRLFHERTKTTCTLPVDVKLAPLPWQYLVVLSHPGDSVRILPNS